MEEKPKRMKVLQRVRNPSLKKKRISKTSKRQFNLFVARNIFSEISQNEEEAVRRTQEAETADQWAIRLRAHAHALMENAIRLRAHAQALMEQADLLTYRAIMATHIFDARCNASASQAAPNSKPDHDVMSFASVD